MTGIPAWVADLAREAEKHYVRWDRALWTSVVEGPARQLGEALGRRVSAAEADRLVLAYLTLAREGIGLGYLVPPSSGAKAFFNAAWFDLLPRFLPELPLEEQPTALAQCWNLGENLQRSPVWLRRLLARRLSQMSSLRDLDTQVAALEREMAEPPSQKLDVTGGGRSRSQWRDLGEEDRRFLPGKVHFIEPLLACVHDRLRTGSDGKTALTQGVWLSDPAVVLGPTGCQEDSEVRERAADWMMKVIPPLDPRFTEPFAASSNAWAAAVTLQTSQAVFLVLPG